MANKAVVNDKTGLVENIIVVDGPFNPGPGLTLREPGNAQIGGTWDGTKFIPPPVKPPVPPRFENDAKAIEGAGNLVALKAILAVLVRKL